VNTLRELRRDASLSQRALAELLDVPVNTLRMWDSGLRSAPPHMLLRVRKAIACHAERTELMPLAQLAQADSRSLLCEVRLWPAEAIGHARSRRAVHRPTPPLLQWAGDMPASLADRA
jgi:transcriptional regulator with XRE-family HTH domain